MALKQTLRHDKRTTVYISDGIADIAGVFIQAMVAITE
jgi:hypothetical protein